MSGTMRPAVYFVVATTLIDAIGFGIVLPVLPQLIMRLGHASLPEATRIGGWLGAIYAAVQFAAGPLAGNLGDRFGRRPVLLGSLLGFAVDYALLGFAPSLGWLFAGRALAGFFGASYGPAGAALADISAPEERARYFGMLSASFGIGFILGPAIGGLLGQLGPRAPFHVAAALAFANLLFGLVAFPETLPRDRRRAFAWRRANPLGALLALRRLPGVLRLATASFWWTLGGSVYQVSWSFWAVAALGWSPGLIGASLAWTGLLMAASQALLVGRVVPRVGERGAAVIGIIAGTAQFMALAFVTRSWMVFVVLLVGMPAQGLVFPALSGLMSRQVPADRQGELQGFNGSVAAVATIVAPLAYTPALAWFTGGGGATRFPGIIYVMATAAGLVALLLLLEARRAPDQMPAATGS